MIAIFLYVAAYLALLNPTMSGIGSLGYLDYIRIPRYRCGEKAVEEFFSPLQQLDHKLRPTYWSGTIVIRAPGLNVPITPKPEN